MWISKIILTNFKSYQHQIFTFPKIEKDRNITLIGGMNGFGKTTLLEAIYLCFYGKEATVQLGRVGLSDSSYVTFLKNALHGKAKLTHSDCMAVNIFIETEENAGYEIRRKWYFDPAGNFSGEEEVQLCKTRNGQSEDYIDQSSLEEILFNHIVPSYVAPLFFFDGEELKKHAEKDWSSFILMGLENLLGVVYLRRLKEDLGDYANLRLIGVPRVDKDALNKKINEQAGLQKERADIDEKCALLKEKIKADRMKRDSILANLKSTGIGSSNKQQIEEILAEEGQKRAQREKIREQLSELITSPLPLNLISKNLRNKLESQLIAENILEDWRKNKEALAPQKGKFKSVLFGHDVIRTLNNFIKTKLDKAVDVAWQSIYNPEPEGCAGTIKHDYLDSKQRTTIQEMIKKSRINGRQIKELSEKAEALNDRIDWLKKRRTQFQAILDDGKLQSWLEEMELLEKSIESLQLKFDVSSRKMAALDEIINQLSATIEKERKRLSDSILFGAISAKAQQVIDMVDELLPKLFTLKTKEVSEVVTKTFQRLSHKKFVSQITINEKGESKIYDSAGEEISVDLSAGEKQIFVTAIIAALAEVSRFDLPIIVDTPLGRLDSVHREKICKYWINTGRQVILLSQDKEIGGNEFEKIRHHVCKTYLLKHEMIRDGIGKTTAFENQYFQGSI